MKNECIACEHSFVGIEQETPCKYCKAGSKYEPVSTDNFSLLLDQTERQRELLEAEFDNFIERW